MRALGTVVLVLGVLAGCTTKLQAIPVAPGVDFAAHAGHAGLVVDEMAGVSPAVLVPAGWNAWSGGPRFLLQAGGKTIAACWSANPGEMFVRQTSDPHSPLVGEVSAAWNEGAIHLTLKPAGGPVFQTSVFDRIDGRVVTAALSSQAGTVLDLRGVYRAELRDSKGMPAGWLRAQISPHQPATRIYDGVLPASLNGPLAAAAVAVLDADVDNIENHALNVYLGN